MEFKYWLENTEITKTNKFKEWFAGSKMVDSSGNPLIFYHGTQAPLFDKFRASDRNIISFTFTPEYAKRYGGFRDNKKDQDKTLFYHPSSRYIEVYLNIKNPFDYRIPEHRKLIEDDYYKKIEKFARKDARFLKANDKIGQENGVTPENQEEKIKEYIKKEHEKIKEYILQGNYAHLEHPKFLKANGFDGVYTFENDNLHIHVLSEDQIWIIKENYARDIRLHH